MLGECDGLQASLVFICGVAASTIPQSQLRAGWKQSELCSDAGVKPLDL